MFPSDFKEKNCNVYFEKGIVKGLSDTIFSPNSQITREQMAVMLDNFAMATAVYWPETTPSIAFVDAATISSWAGAQVEKIVKAGVMNGLPEGTFLPQGNATRGQAAKVIFVLCTVRDGSV